MVFFGSALVGLAVATSIVIKSLMGIAYFAPDACQRLYPYLSERVVGQDVAIGQLANAVCDHLEAADPRKPLIISVHGPPGVGKSLTHYLLARALYSKHPERVTDCPGSQCPGYKVLYGMDYVASQREEQHAALRASLLEHAARSPQALLVIEEYDKLDCSARGLFRQLLENPQVANVSLERSIVMLESNTGYSALHQLLLAAGSRAAVSAEAATKALKDLVFLKWANGGCEDRSDTTKLLGLIDFFLPFFPLDQPALRTLFEQRLAERAAALQRDARLALTWQSSLTDFLVSKVDFDGPYPIEGAKEVGTLMTRYVSAALRAWQRQRGGNMPPGITLRLAPPDGMHTELQVEEAESTPSLPGS